MALQKEFMQMQYSQICGIKDANGLAYLLQVHPNTLYRNRFKKDYDVFYVKKASGKDRLIENPKPELKRLLRSLSTFLQSAYFFNRHPAVYGFLQQPLGSARKRNIVTNAKRHCGKKYLLNIDLEDFFHQLSKVRVNQVFRQPPFLFPTGLSTFLAELCTYKNRLPMGSPVSPVLSNFCMMAADADLEGLAKESKLCYTRYADDLSFSAQECIEADTFQNIHSLLLYHGLRMNPKKIGWMGPSDEKIVTGLILKEKPEIPANFIIGLQQDIERLKHVLEFSAVTEKHISYSWINKFKQQIEGKLRFVQMVYGPGNPVLKGLQQSYAMAFDTQAFAQSFSWDSFPYF